MKKKNQNLYDLFIKDKKIVFIITILFLITGLIIDFYQKKNSPNLYTVLVNTYSLEKYNNEIDKIINSEALRFKKNSLDSLASLTVELLEFDKKILKELLISENIYLSKNKRELKKHSEKFFIYDFHYRKKLNFDNKYNLDQFVLSYKSNQKLPDYKVKRILEKVEKNAKEIIFKTKLKLIYNNHNDFYEENKIKFFKRVEFLNYHLKLAKELGIENSDFNHNGAEYFKNGYKNISIELKALQSVKPENSINVFYYDTDGLLNYSNIRYEDFEKIFNRLKYFIEKTQYFKKIQQSEIIKINPDKKFTIPFAFSGLFISFFLILFRQQK